MATLDFTVAELAALTEELAANPALRLTQEQGILTKPPPLPFATSDVQPPTSQYVTSEDKIRVWVFYETPGTVVHITGRYMRLSGEIVQIEEVVRIASAALPEILTFAIGEAYLLALGAWTSDPGNGMSQVYVRGGLVRGSVGLADIHTELFAGYVSNNQNVSWGTPYHDLLGGGDGDVVKVFYPAPAAGAQLTHTFPTSRQFEMMSFTAILTCSGVVANRYPSLVFTDGINVLCDASADVAQTAGQVRRYTFADFGYNLFSANVLNYMVGTPRIRLPTASVIATLVAGMDAGDSWSAAYCLGRQWTST